MFKIKSGASPLTAHNGCSTCYFQMQMQQRLQQCVCYCLLSAYFNLMNDSFALGDKFSPGSRVKTADKSVSRLVFPPWCPALFPLDSLTSLAVLPSVSERAIAAEGAPQVHTGSSIQTRAGVTEMSFCRASCEGEGIRGWSICLICSTSLFHQSSKALEGNKVFIAGTTIISHWLHFPAVLIILVVIFFSSACLSHLAAWTIKHCLTAEQWQV